MEHLIESFESEVESLAPAKEQGAGLYLHFPYCRQTCTYCDFNSHLVPSDAQVAFDAYHQALMTDIAWQESRSVSTIFWGGGTPSLMPIKALRELTRAVSSKFRLDSQLENTIEVNPGTVNEAGFADYLELGINRVSIGAQSFEPSHLERVGRVHTGPDIEETYRAAQRAGYDNLSLDLIYGFPEQTLAEWRETLERALALEPQHLSVYHLTIEPFTKLEKQLARGELVLPCEDLQADMDDLAMEMLEPAGFHRYEVSNWCLPGRECKHNLLYWTEAPYLGLGCGAVSYIDGWRSERIKAPVYYERALAAQKSPVTFIERRGVDGAIKDALMMGLRIAEGVDGRELCRRFPGLTIRHLEQYFERLPKNWWHRDRERFRLTRKGWDFHSEVVMELMNIMFSFL